MKRKSKLSIFQTTKFKTISVEFCFSPSSRDYSVEYRNIVAKLLMDRSVRNEINIKWCNNVRLTSGVRVENNEHKIIIHLQFIHPDLLPSMGYSVENVINEILYLIFEQEITYEMFLINVKCAIRENFQIYNDKEKYIYLKIIEKSIQNINGDPVVSFKEQDCYKNLSWMKMQNVIKAIREQDFLEIYCVGDVNQEEMRKLFEKRMDTCCFIEEFRENLNDLLIYNKGNEVEFQNISQSKLAISYKISPTMLNNNFWACKLFSIILGGGSPSKLYRRVRGERGMTYHISSALNEDYGIICVFVGTDRKYLKDIEVLIDETIREMENGQITDEEIVIAKFLYLQQLVKDYDRPFKLIKMLRKTNIKSRDFNAIRENVMKVNVKNIMMVSNEMEKLFTFKVVAE